MVHATDPAVVYIHRSDTEVLYVGVTNDYGRRTRQHVDNPKATWWPEVTGTTVHRGMTRATALVVEAVLIKELRPRCNIRHNGAAVSTPPNLLELLAAEGYEVDSGPCEDHEYKPVEYGVNDAALVNHPDVRRDYERMSKYADLYACFWCGSLAWFPPGREAVS